MPEAEAGGQVDRSKLPRCPDCGRKKIPRAAVDEGYYCAVCDLEV